MGSVLPKLEGWGRQSVSTTPPTRTLGEAENLYHSSSQREGSCPPDHPLGGALVPLPPHVPLCQCWMMPALAGALCWQCSLEAVLPDPGQHCL